MPQAREQAHRIVMDSPVPEGSLIVSHENPHQTNCPQGRELRETVRKLYQDGEYEKFEPRGGPPAAAEDDGQCQGKTKKGERCKRDAAEGSKYCSIHG